MNQTTARLLELQQVDVELSKLNAERRNKPSLLRKRRTGLAARESVLEALSKHTKQLQAEVMRRELEVQTREEKIRKLRTQLNLIKANKEYKAMLHEIQYAQAALSEAEDRVLESYEEIEEAGSRARDLEAGILLERAQVEEFAREIEESVAELKRSTQEAGARRKEIAETISRANLSVYERLSQSHPGSAIVPVIAGVCRGCFTRLTSNQQAELLHTEKPLLCASCGRILYVGDDLSAEKLNEPKRYNPLS